ncbi:MAG: IS5 family transposase [Desulfobulbaceae bacterium]|nr:IS5 family transposase [Desulfobulbaceae bacterium]
MKQFGLFDYHKRLSRIDKAGDPLVELNKVVDWEQFRAIINRALEKPRKSPTGAKGYDPILLFKILILRSLYNLYDEAMEYQILDRYSFSRFLGIREGATVPDATTIFRFRDELAKAGVVELLFTQFDQFLREHGFRAQKGQIVDANIVRVPTQRNSREENEDIKAGEPITSWDAPKRREKDTDARWTKKNGKAFFGYKNHVSIDVGHKFIPSYEVTDASANDSQVFNELLDPDNTSKDVWADSAYRSEESLQELQAQGFREHLQRKGYRFKKLTQREQQGNRSRAKIRSRVEHVFGVMAMHTGSTLMRGICIIRIRTKIGLRNLAYNVSRFALLATA